MHHKRKRPRSARAGCKMCKPWKINGASLTKFRTWKSKRDDQDAREQLEGESARGRRCLEDRGAS